MKDGMAMAQAEEEQGSEPGTTVSALVKAAMDGSLTQAFSGKRSCGSGRRGERETGWTEKRGDNDVVPAVR